MKHISVLIVAAAFTLQATGRAQQNSSLLSTVDQFKDDFQNVPCKPKDRLPAARVLFAKMGAPPNAVSIEKLDGVENLVLRQPGASEETIVIGAHYDFAELGCGAVDNWTGIVAVAHLYRSMRMVPTKKTILFVAFGKEEKGDLGSKAMIRNIPKEKFPNYCAMINIDSFGMATPFALENASTTTLMMLAKEKAQQLGASFYAVPIKGADSDSSSFISADIPAVTLSGLSNEWQSVLHTTKDQSSKVNPTSVYLGYRLALAMWNTIDSAPCSAYRTPGEHRPSVKR